MPTVKRSILHQPDGSGYVLDFSFLLTLYRRPVTV